MYLPASPLAQPWSVIGGNVISGLVGVACVRWLGHALPLPLLAGLACGASIAVMFALRCLHPPGGAVALTAGQMSYLLEGIDWRNPQHSWRPESAG